ncbi:MAG: methionyl-tRNA formyltransferase [Ignavibacteria bacterium]|nr:methionyl-tRNA formyltransferase [Ignavibacteria bacterium]
MNIVFMGTPKFAVPSLEILIKNNYNISTVVTQPDRPAGRGLQIQFSEVKKFAILRKLPILQPEDLKSEDFIDTIKKLEPDLIIVVAYRILPPEVFTIPKKGSFNLHASLLPKYRGAAPINWAIINGETETGVTTFFLEEKVDTGNIILQKKINIDFEDTAGTLHDKLSLLGAETVLETVRLIETGNVKTYKQNDTLATLAPKIYKDDCKINWDKNAIDIYNFIRGLSPTPCSYTYFDNKQLKIYSSKVTNRKSIANAGSIIIENRNLYVNTKDFQLQILELQLEGKRKLSAIDFINGLNKRNNLKFS